MVKEFIKQAVNEISFMQLSLKKRSLIIILAVMMPYAAVTGYNLVAHEHVLSAEVYGHRAAIVELAERLVSAKLDQFENLVVSYAARPDVIQYAKSGRPDTESTVLGTAARGDTDVVGVFIVDPAGVLIGVYPPDPMVIGESRADRDWYKEIVVTGQAVVSGVYKRGIRPQVNVVSISSPIRDEQNSIVGYLGFQVSLQRISSWFTSIDVGSGGYIYVVDQVGRLIVHPEFDLVNHLIDFSMEPAVKELLNGKSGSSVYFSAVAKDQELSSYKLDPVHKWGIVFQQPKRAAFAAYYSDMTRMVLVDSMVGLLIFLLVLFGLRVYASVDEAHKRERVFLDSISDGILAIDRNWKITLWNTAMQRFTGLTSKEAIGRYLKEVVKLLRASDRKSNIMFIEEAMLDGEKRYLKDLTVIVDNRGNEASVASIASPIKNSNDTVIGCIITVRNTTEEIFLEKQNTDLIVGLVEELQTPLTIVNSVAKQFSDARQEIAKVIPDMSMGISLIADASQKMTRSVNDIIGKVEERSVESTVSFDLVKMLTQLCERLLPVLSRSGVNVHYEPSKVFIEVLVSDPDVIEQAFAGLLDNAFQLSRSGGQIFITNEIAGRYLKTIIRDTGPGISKEELLNIYSPILSSAGVDKTRVPGLDFLTIKNSIEENGGMITIGSELGVGTTVTVSLPLV